MKTNDETASTRPLTDDNNVPPPSKIVDKGGRRAAAVTSTTTNTTVCSLPLFVARVCSFVVCFVCRGEGNIVKPWFSLCTPITFWSVWYLAFMNATGAKFTMILPMLRHHPLRALCRRAKEIYQFPCEGNVIAWPRGGKERGKKVVNKIGPPVSPWSAFLFVCFARGIVLIFLLTQNNWRETHLWTPYLHARLSQLEMSAGTIICFPLSHHHLLHACSLYCCPQSCWQQEEKVSMDDNASSSASSSTSATTRMSSLHLLPLYRHTFVDSKLIDALFALLVPWPKAMMIIVIFSAIRLLHSTSKLSVSWGPFIEFKLNWKL